MSAPATIGAAAAVTHKRSLVVGDASGENDQHQGKKQKLAPYICPVCTEPFELPQSNDIIRVLGKCPHNLCHTCLVGHINSKNDRTQMQCPVCRHPYPLGHPHKRTDAESLAQTFLTVKDHLLSTQRNEAISQLLSPPPIIPSEQCTAVGCQAVATHNCLVCKLLCPQHNTEALQLKPNHSQWHLAISDLKKEEEVEMEKKAMAAKQRLGGIKEVRSELDQLQSLWNPLSANVVAIKQKQQDAHDIYTSEIRAMKELHALLPLRIFQFEELLDSVEWASYTIDRLTADILKLIQSKRDELNAAERSPPETILRMPNEAIASLATLTPAIIEIKDKLEDESRLTTAQAPDSQQFTHLTEEWKKATLFPSLSENEQNQLNEFLTPTGKSIGVMSELVYKASWHGWDRADFLGCCAGKSHTLMLVKVAGNGYVFGAYIDPVWPAYDEVGMDPSDLDQKVVPDPSKKSFIFSLTNAYDHPIRLSLIDPHSALDLSGIEVRFGRQVMDAQGEVTNPTNMMLFYEDRLGNHPRGIVFNDQNDATFAYQLDEQSKETAPEGFTLDAWTLSGSEDCGASEIEVYRL